MPPSTVWARRLRGLTLAEIRLLLEAAVVLLACEISRWRRPVGRFLAAAKETESHGVADLTTARRIGWAVTRAARYGLPRSQCLVRSLAIQRMLRRRGLAAGELRVGVRVEDGQLLAHAWVEIRGMVVGDTPGYVRSFTSAPDLKFVEL